MQKFSSRLQFEMATIHWNTKDGFVKGNVEQGCEEHPAYAGHHGRQEVRPAHDAVGRIHRWGNTLNSIMKNLVKGIAHSINLKWLVREAAKKKFFS